MLFHIINKDGMKLVDPVWLIGTITPSHPPQMLDLGFPITLPTAVGVCVGCRFGKWGWRVSEAQSHWQKKALWDYKSGTVALVVKKKSFMIASKDSIVNKELWQRLSLLSCLKLFSRPYPCLIGKSTMLSNHSLFLILAAVLIPPIPPPTHRIFKTMMW